MYVRAQRSFSNFRDIHLSRSLVAQREHRLFWTLLQVQVDCTKGAAHLKIFLQNIFKGFTGFSEIFIETFLKPLKRSDSSKDIQYLLHKVPRTTLDSPASSNVAYKFQSFFLSFTFSSNLSSKILELYIMHFYRYFLSPFVP